MDRSQALGILIGTLIGILIVGILLLVAFASKGSVSGTTMTQRRLVLHSAAPPAAVYEWLTRYCPHGLSVDDANPSWGIVILSSRPGARNWGFFYPAYIYPDGSGTRVDLGIKSKLTQNEAVTAEAHLKAARALADLTGSRIEVH